MPEFLGLPCVELKNEVLSLLVTETVGPRILSLSIHGGENLFAEVPDITLDCPGSGKNHLRGGHRFWVAPEVPRTTYLPDDNPVAIEKSYSALRIVQPKDEATGLQKSLVVSFGSADPLDESVVVAHKLTNCGSTPVTCSPWAITSFKPGGFAVLDMPRIPQDRLGLQPDRQITLWPYTDVRSPHLDWGNEYTFVHARLSHGALKLGFSGAWLAYFRARTLFIKVAGDKASSECYCNPQFLELETLGPRTTIQPGESIAHSETWWVHDNLDLEPKEASFVPWKRSIPR